MSKMTLRLPWLALSFGMFFRSRGYGDEGLMSLLFMADIGHPREHKDRLTRRWPMGKCAFEGAFSLYEGLHDYVTRQRAHPTAVFVLGDVAYGGGTAEVNNDTRLAFQKYLAGKVPEDRIFVNIGNHDVNYMGCTDIDIGHCYYGDNLHLYAESFWQMTFQQWRRNWLQYFPGLVKHAIIPSSLQAAYVAPLRYNLNLDRNSSVYLIAGLLSGSHNLKWNGDTPRDSRDGMLEPLVECTFLRDSIAHGRSLGKTIFIYLTHNFGSACTDWSVVQQIDVWMTGHKHNFWQSAHEGEVILQEKRHFPMRILIGNGGFDEGHINTVSFGHVTEKIHGDRVLLDFKIFDTCISDGKCPDTMIPKMEACWRTCTPFPGGFDNGGGPRKAIKSSHGYGFQFDAPVKPLPAPQNAPWGGSWKLELASQNNNVRKWFVLGNCPAGSIARATCITTGEDENAATIFTFYNAFDDGNHNVNARLAVEDKVRAPVMVSEMLLYRPAEGFWSVNHVGLGQMRPSDGFQFDFAKIGDKAWKLHDVAFEGNAQVLMVVPGSSLSVSFVPAGTSHGEILV